MTDTKKLRAIAEAATPGEWKHECVSGRRMSACGPVVRPTAGPTGASPDGIGEMFDDECGCLHHADATHIATFDPPTVLALLDEVEEFQGDPEYRQLYSQRAEAIAAKHTLKAENKRLREALETIESMATIECEEQAKIARAALGGSDE